MLKPSLNLAALPREKTGLSLSVGCQPSELRGRLLPSNSSTLRFPVIKSSRPSCAQHQLYLPEEVDWSGYRRPGDTYSRTDNEGPFNDVWTHLSFSMDSDTREVLVEERTHNYQSDPSHEKQDPSPRRFFGRGRALHDFVARRNHEITVRRDDEVLILEHPAKSISKRGIQYEWEGWLKVRLLRNGREGEVPSSRITEVETTSKLKRQVVRRYKLQSLDSPLPAPRQLIAGVGHTSVCDNTAMAKLARQWMQYITSRDLPPVDHHVYLSRHMSLARRSQLPEWSGGAERPTLTRAHSSDPGNLQEACDEDAEPEFTSIELRNRVANRLGCLNRSDAMFVHYTISEDRTGCTSDFVATRLAALGTHRSREHDLA